MPAERNFAVVNGLGFGEETKGNTVQALVRELDAHTVWRSGGWQGGHHIIHDDGREMALSHFGAGVFEGANTYLKHMVVSPVELFQEAIDLENLGVVRPLETIVIDEDCIATTPFHSGISRVREVLRGPDRKGTIGKGVGEAIKDSSDANLTIRAGEFKDRATVLRKVETIRRAKLIIAEQLIASYQGVPPQEVYDEMSVLKDEALVPIIADAFSYASSLIKVVGDEYLRDLLLRRGSIVNEVSHGALHHPWYGFVPHVTQIDPTAQDVLATVRSHDYNGNLIRIGVTRTYLTRHGAGPLVSFDQNLTDEFVETHNNAANEWLGNFRTGHFDTVALRYALEISGGAKSFDGLFVSFMDVLSGKSNWQVCEAYEYKGVAYDINDYFIFDGARIIGIKVHPNTRDKAHYKHQLRLTQLLKNCRPVLTTLSETPEKNLEQVFREYVEEKLGVAVVGTAYGPKATDRQFLPAWQKILR